MSKFQKVEKFTESAIIVIGDLEISTPSSTSKVLVGVALENTPMCNIKSTDKCPIGFVSSTYCVGQNDTDVNTNYCILDYDAVNAINTPS
jgi:hypothetical protein